MVYIITIVYHIKRWMKITDVILNKLFSMLYKLHISFFPHFCLFITSIWNRFSLPFFNDFPHRCTWYGITPSPFFVTFCLHIYFQYNFFIISSLFFIYRVRANIISIQSYGDNNLHMPAGGPMLLLSTWSNSVPRAPVVLFHTFISWSLPTETLYDIWPNNMIIITLSGWYERLTCMRGVFLLA